MAEKEYIERDALCYQLAKQATLDNWDNFCHHCGADMREES